MQQARTLDMEGQDGSAVRHVSRAGCDASESLMPGLGSTEPMSDEQRAAYDGAVGVLVNESGKVDLRRKQIETELDLIFCGTL